MLLDHLGVGHYGNITVKSVVEEPVVELAASHSYARTIKSLPFNGLPSKQCF